MDRPGREDTSIPSGKLCISLKTEQCDQSVYTMESFMKLLLIHDNSYIRPAQISAMAANYIRLADQPMDVFAIFFIGLI